MSGSFDQVVSGGLHHGGPRPGFAAELLVSLREAYRNPTEPIVLERAGRPWWFWAGSVAGAVGATAGLAAYGATRISNRAKRTKRTLWGRS